MNKLRKVSLRIRLLTAFVFLVIIPLIVTTGIALRIYSNSIREKLSQSTKQTIQITNNSISTLLHIYADTISSISVTAQIQGFLQSKTMEGGGSVEEYLFSNLSNRAPVAPRSNNAPIFDMCVADTAGTAYYYHGSIFFSKEVMKEIMTKADSSSPRDCLSLYYSQRGVPLLIMGRKIYDDRFRQKHIGYIIVSFKANSFNRSSFPSTALGEGANLLLVDNDGLIMASQDQSLIGTKIGYDDYKQAAEDPSLSAEFKRSSYSVISTYNREYDLFAIAEVPDSLINSEIRRVQRLIIAILIPILLLCIFLILVISRSVTQPIGRMVDVYKTEQGQLPEDRVHDLSPDELGFLSRTIDTMADQNRDMLLRIEEDDKKKRELELEMLRYQINPHFLFNTLNTLKWMASLNDAPALSDGIASLSSLLRGTLMEKAEFIPLENEIRTLRDYCSIQSLRYVDRFDVRYDIAESALPVPVPRLILQPLVENAILHAGGEEDVFVTITVTARTEGRSLYIEVADDGAGFNVDTVHEKGSTLYKGIGLSNVDSRLRLHYGEENGLLVSSAIGSGTVCTIRIPCGEEKDEGAAHV